MLIVQPEFTCHGMMKKFLNRYPSYPHFPWLNDCEIKHSNMGTFIKNTVIFISLANGQHDRSGYLPIGWGRISLYRHLTKSYLF